MNNKNTNNIFNSRKSIVVFAAIVAVVLFLIGIVFDSKSISDIGMTIFWVTLASLAASSGFKKAKSGDPQKYGEDIGEVKQDLRNMFQKDVADHSHDQLSGYRAGDCTPDEHWRRQLDDFKKAGLIDNDEYHKLLKRGSKPYDPSQN